MSLNIAQQFMKEMIKLFWYIKNSGGILNKLKSRGFLASGLSTYVFSTLYTTLPYNLIKEKLTELIEQTFPREGSLYLACNDKMPLLLLNNVNDINYGRVRKCVMLSIIFWSIYLKDLARNYIDKLYVFQWVLIVLLLLQIFLFCYERDFILSLSDDTLTDLFEAFNSTSRYLDDYINIDNAYFEQVVGRMYPTELQLNKANSSDTEVPFLDLKLSITNDIVSSKIYDKRDDFNFEIVTFTFLGGVVPRSPSYGVYISQLRVCSNVDDFNNRNFFNC